ncbi:hypothetical protein R2F61_08955 [Mollicutes bacterium LVI A0078]|nr:hypothetical protein RZE84_08730 [Mollicutes bacterium LVI A0075]WOO90829.1 hypothetical protein R2F61_08955 [Mollicutes bacterium LVI A0078]
MIRSVYTNAELKKVAKYQKFVMLRTFNSLVITILAIFITFNAITLVKTNPLQGLIYFLAFSFVIYIVVAMHNKSFYGLFTPMKLYQEHIMIVIKNNKGKLGLLAIVNTLFLTVLVYFVITHNIIVIGVFAVITLLIHLTFIDLNDVSKIAKKASKFDIDIDDYRLCDNDIFENLTTGQAYYVHSVREELVAFIALNKELTATEFKQKLDREEYLLVTMISKQMERFGK